MPDRVRLLREGCDGESRFIVEAMFDSGDPVRHTYLTLTDAAGHFRTTVRMGAIGSVDAPLQEAFEALYTDRLPAPAAADETIETMVLPPATSLGHHFNRFVFRYHRFKIDYYHHELVRIRITHNMPATIEDPTSIRHVNPTNRLTTECETCAEFFFIQSGEMSDDNFIRQVRQVRPSTPVQDPEPTPPTPQTAVPTYGRGPRRGHHNRSCPRCIEQTHSCRFHWLPGGGDTRYPGDCDETSHHHDVEDPVPADPGLDAAHVRAIEIDNELGVTVHAANPLGEPEPDAAQHPDFSIGRIRFDGGHGVVRIPEQRPANGDFSPSGERLFRNDDIDGDHVIAIRTNQDRFYAGRGLDVEADHLLARQENRDLIWDGLSVSMQAFAIGVAHQAALVEQRVDCLEQAAAEALCIHLDLDHQAAVREDQQQQHLALIESAPPPRIDPPEGSIAGDWYDIRSLDPSMGTAGRLWQFREDLQRRLQGLNEVFCRVFEWTGAISRHVNELGDAVYSRLTSLESSRRVSIQQINQLRAQSSLNTNLSGRVDGIETQIGNHGTLLTELNERTQSMTAGNISRAAMVSDLRTHLTRLDRGATDAVRDLTRRIVALEQSIGTAGPDRAERAAERAANPVYRVTVDQAAPSAPAPVAAADGVQQVTVQVNDEGGVARIIAQQTPTGTPDRSRAIREDQQHRDPAIAEEREGDDAEIEEVPFVCSTELCTIRVAVAGFMCDEHAREVREHPREPARLRRNAQQRARRAAARADTAETQHVLADNSVTCGFCASAPGSRLCGSHARLRRNERQRERRATARSARTRQRASRRPRG